METRRTSHATMEDRAEMEIVVEAPNSIATTVKRSNRAKPSAKAREALLMNEINDGTESTSAADVVSDRRVLHQLLKLAIKSQTDNKKQLRNVL